MIVGHGLRERKLVAPTDRLDEVGLVILVLMRRYLCRACNAVLTVMPRGILRRRRYCAFAIAWALALFGLLRMAPEAVRERVTTWRLQPDTTNIGWPALKRWAREVRDQRLFGGVPRAPPPATLRRVAERAAMGLAGQAPVRFRELSIDLRAAYGGASS